MLDGAIANVALPTIAADLRTSPAESVWIVNAYQLAIIVCLLPFSFLGEMVGYRRVYQAGLLLFSCTSLLYALADSLTPLTLARVLQGIGGAALMSVNTALIRIIWPRRCLGRGLSINSLVVAVASAAGPTVAAGILAVGHWPWLFLINLPLGALALALGWRFLPPNPLPASTRRFDLPSAVMNALFFGLLVALLSGVAQGQSRGVLLGELLLLLLVTPLFIRRQCGLAVPLLPVDLLRIPLFSLSIAASVCAFCAQMLAMVSLPFWLQSGLGRSEVTSGLLLTPWPLATMVLAPIAGRLIERFHAGLLGAVGLGLFACGLLLLALLPTAPTDADIIWRMALCGAGFGLFQSPNNHTLITAAPPVRSGGASGMLDTARLLGQTSGAALVALMFNLFAASGTHASLLLAAGFAAAATLVSALRLSQPDAVRPQ